MTVLAKYLIRFGLAFVFGYAAFEMYFRPENFIRYVPTFISNHEHIELFLKGFGIKEILLSVWLLTGWKGHYAALVSLFLIVGITGSNLEYFPVLFRNVAIGFAALALFLLESARQSDDKVVSVSLVRNWVLRS
jgi:hypothetical protein